MLLSTLRASKLVVLHTPGLVGTTLSNASRASLHKDFGSENLSWECMPGAEFFCIYFVSKGEECFEAYESLELWLFRDTRSTEYIHYYIGVNLGIINGF